MLQIGAALFYYVLGHTLLQIGAALLLKIRASVVTMGQLLQIGKNVLQIGAGITS